MSRKNSNANCTNNVKGQLIVDIHTCFFPSADLIGNKIIASKHIRNKLIDKEKLIVYIVFKYSIKDPNPFNIDNKFHQDCFELRFNVEHILSTQLSILFSRALKVQCEVCFGCKFSEDKDVLLTLKQRRRINFN